MKIEIGMRKAYRSKTDSRAVCLCIDFDHGNVVNGLGDRKIVPNVPHGCIIDHENNFWTAGNGDGIIQKYGHDGKLLMQIGKKGVVDTSGGLSWSMSVTGKVTGSKFSTRWETSRTTSGSREKTAFQIIGAPHGGSGFPSDREQKYMYVDDGGRRADQGTRSCQRRSSLELGRPGHQIGAFTHGHTLALDSKGNVYVTETERGPKSPKS
jgi:hypothetical protein